MPKYKEIESTVQPTKLMNRTRSPSIFSPVDSPKTSSSKNSSPKPDLNFKKESKSILRLLSCRITDSNYPASLPISPCKGNDHSISSAESDGEVIVCLNSEMPTYFISFVFLIHLNLKCLFFTDINLEI